MKILLIGHSIIDHHGENGEPKPGGVYYSVLGFLSSFKPNDRLMLLTGKNSKNSYLFTPLYSDVDLSLSNEIDEMPEVFLYTSGEFERKEVYKNISSNLKIDKLNELSDYDGILINMITGFDISLKQLKLIRKNYAGLIYLDIHTLSRGLDDSGNREFRMIPQIEEWLGCVDILQSNENELKTICGIENEKEGAEWILSKGVTTLLITKAQNGAMLYSKNGEISKINGEKIVVKNKIGCGDIFGATFFYSYIFNSDNTLSLRNANHAGAVAASTEDLFNCKRIPV